MQRMKPYAASCRIIHGVGEKMIDVDQHGCGHRHPGSNKFVAKKYHRDHRGNRKMESKVYITTIHLCVHRQTKKAAQKLGGIVSKRCIRPGWNRHSNHPDINVIAIPPVHSQYLRFATSAGKSWRGARHAYLGSAMRGIAMPSNRFMLPARLFADTACCYTSSPCVPIWYGRNATTSCAGRRVAY